MKMFQLLILTALLLKAWASQISGYGNTTADYGGEAYYRCTLQNPTGVLQVTWQRLFKDETLDNLASYSKRYGQQVNNPYLEKLTITEASLNSSSITLRNVTWGDESCYICSFNAYPEGSQRKQTCLTVQGISEVKTGVQETEGSQDVLFSCSATGKPAPSIQWVVSTSVTSPEETETITVTNSDHTFTSSRNIKLKVPADWKGDVDCLVNSGMRGERRERIPFPSDLGPGEDKEEEGGGISSAGIAFVIIAVMFLSCIIVVAVIKQRRLKFDRGFEHVESLANV